MPLVGPPARRLTIGQTVADRYEVRALIGQGGAGAVYEVYDRQRAVECALKLNAPLNSSQATTGWRLRREFYLMSQLAHPNIARVLDWGESDEHLFYTMELIRGRDAYDLIPMSVDDVLDVLVSLASALGFVHARGFTHQDVKPRNICISSTNSEDNQATRATLKVTLMDFGLLSPIGAIIAGDEKGARGTPGYIAPEVLFGAPADTRSDLYGVGVTAHVLLTGLLPPKLGVASTFSTFDGETVPPLLVRLVSDLLAEDPARRPADAAELLERLAPLTPATQQVQLTAPAYLAAPPLIGRDEEITRLRAAWARASQGKGAAVFVLAPPGMGKTRLLASFALEARIAGATVTETTGNEQVRTPFSALGQLLSPLAAEGRLSQRVAPRVLALLNQMIVGDARVAENAERAMPAVCQAAMALIGTACAQRPVVLVVDNLHECDAASVEAFEYLGRGARTQRLLLLASARHERGAATPLVERLRRGSLDVVTLEPLGREQIEELWRSLFAHQAIAAPIIDDVYQSAGGNPYLAIEIARLLIEDGVITFEGGRWRLPRSLPALSLPTTLDGALLERLTRLGPAARRVAGALAVARDATEGSVLELVTGLDEPGLFKALDELERKQVATTWAGWTALAHARLREVLYDELEGGERERLHRLFGHLFVRRLDETAYGLEHGLLVEKAGHHLARGGPEVELYAVPWLRQSGEVAYHAGEFLDATRPLCEAAQILERHGSAAAHPELMDIWERLCVAAGGCDLELGMDIQRRMLEHLERTGSWSALARRAKIVGARLALLGGLVEAATGRLAIDGLGALRGAVRDATRYAMAIGYQTVAQTLVGRLDEARDSHVLIARFAQAQGGAAVAFAQVARAGITVADGHFEEGLTATLSAVRKLKRATLTGFETEVLRARYYAFLLRAWIRVIRGETDEIEELFERLSHTPDLSDITVKLHSLILPSAYHARRGEITKMLAARAAFFDQSLKFRGTWSEAELYPTTTPALAEAGFIARARDDLRSFDAVMPAGPFRDIWSRIFQGVLHVVTGDPRQGAELLDQARQQADGKGVHSDLWAITALGFAAEAWLAAGHDEEASVRAAEAMQRSQAPAIRFRWMESRARRVRARVALRQKDLAAASAQASRMVALAEALDNPGEIAHGKLLDAEVAATQGHRDRAAKLALQAEAAFTELGNGHWAQESARLATQSRATGVALATASDEDTVIE